MGVIRCLQELGLSETHFRDKVVKTKTKPDFRGTPSWMRTEPYTVEAQIRPRPAGVGGQPWWVSPAHSSADRCVSTCYFQLVATDVGARRKLDSSVFYGKNYICFGVLRLHITGFMVPSYFLNLTSFQQKSFYFPLDLIHHGTFVSERKVAVA